MEFLHMKRKGIKKLYSESPRLKKMNNLYFFSSLRNGNCRILYTFALYSALGEYYLMFAVNGTGEFQGTFDFIIK